MSFDPETTRIVRSWLDEGVTELPDRVLDTVLDELPATPQRRPIWSAWRTPIMNKIIATGLGAAAVVIALVVGAQLFGTTAGGVGGPGPDATTPTPEPTAEPTPKPTSTPEAGLPVGPLAYGYPGMSDDVPRITLTIPAPGWTEPDPGILIKGDELENVPEAAILVWSEPSGTEFYVYGDPCRSESTRPATPATTVDQIVTALAAQASRDASETVDVTVDGYAGKRITLRVPDDADLGACERGEFVMFGTQDDALQRYHQGPGQIDDVWVIDVDGSVVIFDTMYRPDTSDELIEEMRSIAGSATFEVP
ncbi:MAG TPA: hypothetical protein VM344_01910 [Vitreimonas sp.]|nr:hypothetical protein [Vitreimonas sp.]